MDKCPTVESGLAGRAESCKGCPNANNCISAKPDTDIVLIKERLQNIKLILAVLSGKGGVGKSTISKNIAEELSKRGIKTILLDLDLSGPSIPRLTNTMDEYIVDVENLFDPIKINESLSVLSMGHLEAFEEPGSTFTSNVKNFILKKILINCKLADFEVMVIDTPPNITEEHLGLANYIKPHAAIMVTTPQKLSFDDVIRQLSFCKKTNIEVLGIIENMKNFRCRKCETLMSIFPDSDVVNWCTKESVNYLGSLELKALISKSSDNGENIQDPFFYNLTNTIVEKFKLRNDIVIDCMRL